MSTFWYTFIFLYIYIMVNTLYSNMFRAALGIKQVKTGGELSAGVVLLLAGFSIVVWGVITYGMTHLLMWWIGV